MPFYHSVTIARSDALLQVRRRDGSLEPNQPTTEQLDQKVQRDKDESCKDYYRKVLRGSEKDIDWRRKLGGMLMHLTGSPEQLEKQWILEDFPEHYVLWEHVKYAVDNNGGAKRSETTHAAGGMERQDAYLYGHPQGRKKRYRSPTEFFEHLIWLAADPHGDPRNCACKICAPLASDQAENSEEPPAASPVSTPTPAPRSREQIRDRDANSVWLYRLGEMVWFSKGPAWGLAIIAKRQEVTGKPRYLLQPLSNPLRHAKSVIKNREDDLRPWLAWSVPTTTHEAINNLTFENVPWERVLNGGFGRGDAEVDGSILAAKAIDISYSFFGRLEVTPSRPGETHWNAMFLGAEKIWVGEPVRLRGAGDGAQNADIFVMIIHQLIEKVQVGGQNTSAVTLVGDVYKFITTTEKPLDQPNYLPIRMTADLRFRNEAARAASRNEYYHWTLVEGPARRSIGDVKGRWYETRRLLPTLRTQDVFQQDLSRGMTSDVGQWMNGRGDSTSFNGGKRKKNRKDTLGKSVPENFAISKGLDATDSKGLAYDDNVFPDNGMDQTMGGVENPILLDDSALGMDADGLDQFMNLDDAGSGFFTDTLS